MTNQQNSGNAPPACVRQYIRQVVQRMHWKRSARADVRQELVDHFTDALAACPAQERETRAEALVAAFGEAKVLGQTIRRGKWRCRPLYRRALIRSLQGFALLVVLVLLYLGWIASGTSTVRVDYLAMLNRMNQPVADERQNAWGEYERAIAAFVKPPATVAKPPEATRSAEDDPMMYPSRTVPWQQVEDTNRRLADVPAFEQEALRDWVGKNDACWQHYVAASRKPYCWQQYTVPADAADAPAMNSILWPNLAPVRQLARMGIWRARFAAQQGRTQEAIEDCLAVAQQHLQKPTDVLISQLVGQAVADLACQEILDIVSSQALPAELLQRTQEALEALYPAGYPIIDIEAEKMFFLDVVQWLFTDGGPGGGHIIPRKLQAGFSIMEGSRQPRESWWLWVLTSAVQAGRNATLAQGNAMYDLMIEQAKMTPLERRKDTRNVLSMMMSLPRWRYMVLYAIVPSMDRVGEMSFRSKALYEATVTVLALQRYKNVIGEYPETLDNLVSGGYLKQIPKDPYSAGPLVYRKTQDGFTLYSVAGDFKDDGGKPIPKNEWEPSWQGKTGGDHVFWPVQVQEVAAAQDNGR